MNKSVIYCDSHRECGTSERNSAWQKIECYIITPWNTMETRMCQKLLCSQLNIERTHSVELRQMTKIVQAVLCVTQTNRIYLNDGIFFSILSTRCIVSMLWSVICTLVVFLFNLFSPAFFPVFKYFFPFFVCKSNKILMTTI